MSEAGLRAVRKRMRSSESAPFEIQSKFFVTQRLIHSQDGEKMREICNKTVHILFDAINKLDKSEKNDTLAGNLKLFEEINLCGNGKITFKNKLKPSSIPDTPKQSKCCLKDSFISTECNNCNLILCEFCGYSCVQCSKLLCNTCVTIFACGSPEIPCCEQCKIYF